MIRRERLSATVEGSLVVFLIGMRVNKPWKVHRWWPVAQAMPRMLAELNMPAFGLGKFGKLTPATGVLQSAEGRLRASDRGAS